MCSIGSQPRVIWPSFPALFLADLTHPAGPFHLIHQEGKPMACAISNSLEHVLLDGCSK